MRIPLIRSHKVLFWRKRSFSPLGTISEWSESASEGSRGTARHSLNPTGPTSWAPSFRPQPSTRQLLELVFFSINNSRHARPLASICHFLPSLHCPLFPSLVSAPWFVPGCLHHENSRKQVDHLVFLPRPLPIRLLDTRTNFHQEPQHLHNSIDHEPSR